MRYVRLAALAAAILAAVLGTSTGCKRGTTEGNGEQAAEGGAGFIKKAGESLKEKGRDAAQSVENGAVQVWDEIKGTIEPLSEQDIQQYIQAYENFAEISPKLEEERKRSNSISIFTCKECRSLLLQAVQDAGYSDLKSFLAMDLRIHYTMRAVAYLKIAELLGGLADEISAEEVRAKPELMEGLDETERDEVTGLYDKVAALDRHIKKIGSLFKAMAERILQKGDLELVSKHFDAIHSALTNADLPSELNHSGGGDWDD